MQYTECFLQEFSQLANSRKKNFGAHPTGRCRTLWGERTFAFKNCYIGVYDHIFRRYRPLKPLNDAKNSFGNEISGSIMF